MAYLREDARMDFACAVLWSMIATMNHNPVP